MDYQGITEQYYARWLGTEYSGIQPGEVWCVYSAERNHAQYGYGKPIDLLLFIHNGGAVLSYGEKAADRIPLLAQTVGASPEIKRAAAGAGKVYGVQPECGIKFVYQGPLPGNIDAVTLGEADFSLFLDFYRKRAAGPQAYNLDWLESYFYQHVQDGFFCAVMEAGQIVSCTDAPGMPYLSDRVQEIGIFTLPDFRSRGYALRACAAAAQNIIKSGRCPQWSTSADNIASQVLASRVGFAPLADTCMLTL